MSVIYPQIFKPGGFGMGLCVDRYSQATLATPTCFCISLFWWNPVCLPPHHHQSAWMYSTSRSSICFCPPMKRTIIICRMHSWRAASCVWANQGSAVNLDHKSKRPQPHPQAHFYYPSSLSEFLCWTSFYNNIVFIIPFPLQKPQAWMGLYVYPLDDGRLLINPGVTS